MFTLKIASPEGDRWQTTWLPGVTSVTSYVHGPPEEVDAYISELRNHIDFDVRRMAYGALGYVTLIHASMIGDPPDDDPEFGFWAVVKKAWLLGPDGQTIERIAP